MGHNRSWIVSPSWSIPGNDDDPQPPHRQAAAYYRKVAGNKIGEFKVTMDHPTASKPEPMTFIIDTIRCTRMYLAAVGAVTFPHEQKTSRAGHGN